MLAATVTGVLALLAVARTRIGTRVDHAVLQRVIDLLGGGAHVARDFISLTTNASVLLTLAVLALVALLRRRVDLAIGAVVLVLGGSATTEAVKAVTAGSLPSGHVTAMAGLACAAALVVTRSLRPVVVALGTLAVVAQALALLILRDHQPLDVVAGVLVALGWTAAVVLVAPRRAR